MKTKIVLKAIMLSLIIFSCNEAKKPNADQFKSQTENFLGKKYRKVILPESSSSTDDESELSFFSGQVHSEDSSKWVKYTIIGSKNGKIVDFNIITDTHQDTQEPVAMSGKDFFDGYLNCKGTAQEVRECVNDLMLQAVKDCIGAHTAEENEKHCWMWRD